MLWPRWRSPSLRVRLAEIRPCVVQEVNGVHTNLALVAAGVGISLLPTSVRALTRTGVTYRTLTEPAPTSTLAAAWHSTNSSPLLASFLRVLHTTIERVGLSTAQPTPYGPLST